MPRTVNKHIQRRPARSAPPLSQKAKKFYTRYGQAIRLVREQAGIELGTIPRLSLSRLRRIERGECRPDSKVITVLAKAHHLTPNEYLDLIAKNLAHLPRIIPGRTPRKSVVVIPAMIDAHAAAILKRQAKKRRTGLPSMASLYLREKIVEHEYPGIGFRDSVHGREVYLQNHRLALWEVADLFKREKTVARTSEKLGWSPALVRCALRYAKTFASEVARQRKAAKPGRNDHLTEFLLKQAFERGDSLRRKLVEQEGGSFSVAETARELRISKAAVMRRYRNATLISWREEHTGPIRFPVWQFRAHKVLAGIGITLKVLNDDDLINDWGRMIFFLSPSRCLGGKRPLDYLRTGKVAQVLQAAQMFTRKTTR